MYSHNAPHYLGGLMTRFINTLLTYEKATKYNIQVIIAVIIYDYEFIYTSICLE
jgi:hypothetical protein